MVVLEEKLELSSRDFLQHYSGLNHKNCRDSTVPVGHQQVCRLRCYKISSIAVTKVITYSKREIAFRPVSINSFILLSFK